MEAFDRLINRFLVLILVLQVNFVLGNQVRQLTKELSDLQLTVGDNCKELDVIRHQFDDDPENY